jgi:hypothetical protein
VQVPVRTPLLGREPRDQQLLQRHNRGCKLLCSN